MRCVIAKINPVLMDMAIKHYLENENGTETPLFTFKSLWSDEEPYPLDELLFCLDERIADLEEQFKAHPIENTVIALNTLRRKRAKLAKVHLKMSKNDRPRFKEQTNDNR